MLLFINYLIDVYLKRFHDYKISMDLSKGKTILTVFFTPLFILKNRYSKVTIDSIVEDRLHKYYMDDISHVRNVYYINRITGRIDKFRSVFKNI